LFLEGTIIVNLLEDPEPQEVCLDALAEVALFGSVCSRIRAFWSLDFAVCQLLYFDALELSTRRERARRLDAKI
jgi:hypothetical protein